MEENKRHHASTSAQAVLAYERDDGHLSIPEVFGTDLGNQQLQKLRFDNFNSFTATVCKQDFVPTPGFYGYIYCLIHVPYSNPNISLSKKGSAFKLGDNIPQ